MTITNEEYLQGLSSGDRIIILEIYNIIYPKVRYFILKNNGTQQESEEIFQEALCQLIMRLKTSEIIIKSSFEAYFFTVCKNLWRKELISRKRWVRNDDLITQTPVEDRRDKLLDEESQWQLFEEKLEELSENCKELLKLYFKKVSYDEIVQKFQYSSENVAFQRMFKCKKKLKDLVKKDPRFKNLS